MEKFDYIRFTAKLLCEKGTTMVADDLAEELNKRNYTTDRGDEFVGGIGIYKLISSTYHRLTDNGEHDDADEVARAFTKPDGNYAYD